MYSMFASTCDTITTEIGDRADCFGHKHVNNLLSSQLPVVDTGQFYGSRGVNMA